MCYITYVLLKKVYFLRNKRYVCQYHIRGKKSSSSSAGRTQLIDMDISFDTWALKASRSTMYMWIFLCNKSWCMLYLQSLRLWKSTERSTTLKCFSFKLSISPEKGHMKAFNDVSQKQMKSYNIQNLVIAGQNIICELNQELHVSFSTHV